MTEISVSADGDSGETKMTETPYQWRRVGRYAFASTDTIIAFYGTPDELRHSSDSGLLHFRYRKNRFNNRRQASCNRSRSIFEYH